ncbi:oligopeptide transport system permease protein [Marinococcus luteus]|uniref:Oligopeptide transport system permease protein n=1 Tax=Marinococcus luteus TaxID=1122204 RepID=A0A1H2W6T4_9BACI|nr:oligopeptide ABC transporter permease [Marinococcus luteus]SDW76231.1 oligopeptide transport system permease protein [Marinococcus luteus]
MQHENDKEKKYNKELFSPADVNEEETEKINRQSRTFWQDAFRALRKNVAAMISLAALVLITLLAIFGPMMNEYTPREQDLSRSNLPPKAPVLENIGFLNMDGQETYVFEHISAEQAQMNAESRFGEGDYVEYETLSEGDGSVGSAQVQASVDTYAEAGVEENFWFGTDRLGRDQWTRTWDGTRVSLYIALIATLLDLFIGVAYGGISGFFGGRTDNILQRILEILSGIPNLVILILMIVVLDPGILSISLAIAITGWIGMSRIVRGEILKLKNEEFVLASQTLGLSNSKVITRHLVPNTLGLIIINTMFTIPNAIFFEAFLSFIGLGLQAPNASLGVLIDNGFDALQTTPHVLIFPAVVLSVLMIAFNILADGMRDAFDPKMRD